MARQISLIIVGAGDRGQLYADLAARDPGVRIAAVADPDERRRTTLAERHAVPSTRRYSHWRDLIEQPRIADAAVIATLDRLHHEPALALAAQGYHLLLEKPMAVTPDMCRSIVEAARAARVTLAVCHVLRYTAIAGCCGDCSTRSSSVRSCQCSIWSRSAGGIRRTPSYAATGGATTSRHLC